MFLTQIQPNPIILGKPQLAQLPNYQNYQNAIKVKIHMVNITKKKKPYSIDLNFQKNKSKQIPWQFTQTLRLFAEKMQETIKTKQKSRMRDSKKKNSQVSNLTLQL